MPAPRTPPRRAQRQQGVFERAGTAADREAHPRKTRTVLHYGGHRFVVDGTILGLRLWYRSVLVSRRWGFGL
ncbi:MAG: hypothetical protein V9H25_06935 [Candidatus Competibacter sp.]